MGPFYARKCTRCSALSACRCHKRNVSNPSYVGSANSFTTKNDSSASSHGGSANNSTKKSTFSVEQQSLRLENGAVNPNPSSGDLVVPNLLLTPRCLFDLRAARIWETLKAFADL